MAQARGFLEPSLEIMLLTVVLVGLQVWVDDDSMMNNDKVERNWVYWSIFSQVRAHCTSHRILIKP